MNNRTLLYLSALLILLGASTTALADVPDSVNYQGILLDSGGDPVTTPTSVTFIIYDAPTSGANLWDEIQSITPDAEGRFNTFLGSINPIDESVFGSPERWLEVTVSGDPPMPRVKIVSVPFSFRVATIDSAAARARLRSEWGASCRTWSDV